MGSDRQETTEQSDDIVLVWREECAMALGYEQLDARKIAHDSAIEIRKLEKMIKAGCSHATAVRALRS